MTSRRFGGHIILTLTRWRAEEPPTPYNLVLIMQNEAQKLAEQGHSAFPPEVVERIEKRLEWAKKVFMEEIEPYNYGPAEIYWPELSRKLRDSLHWQCSQLSTGFLAGSGFGAALGVGLSYLFLRSHCSSLRK